MEVPALAKEVFEEPVEIAKRTRAGVHIINKRGLNAKSKNEPLQFPSHLLPNLPATLTLSVKRSLPLASPVQPLPQRPQRAYGSSEAPLNEYEQVLFEMNGLLPVAALLQIGPYVVPLLVLRFVVDKTGRFLALVTCPWSKSRRVFSLFHFFKNMLHLLHQMDKDARLALLQKFGDSQVLFFEFFLQTFKNTSRSARRTTTSSCCLEAFALSSRRLGRTSTLETCGAENHFAFWRCRMRVLPGLRTANWGSACLT